MDTLQAVSFAQSSELIDTLWNVNTKQTVKQKTLTTELIDTLWNVNGDSTSSSPDVSELIDTLWNVNANVE